MSNNDFRPSQVGAGIAGALLLASCAGAQQAAGSDKAGGDADPVVLTMADPYQRAGPTRRATLRRPGRGAVRRLAARRRAT